MIVACAVSTLLLRRRGAENEIYHTAQTLSGVGGGNVFNGYGER